jgi:hypothetical protein
MKDYRYEIDLYWDDSGDFTLDSETNDLEDTKNHQYRTLIQKIDTQIMSNAGEWRLQPQVGAGLSRFLGRPNTRDTGNSIKRQLMAALTANGLLSPQEVTVDVLPMDDRQIAIVVLVFPYLSNKKITRLYSYNMSNNRITPRI